MSITILFQGDSITDCGRNVPGAAGYNSHGLGPGYPLLIASRLYCDAPERDWNIINRGISGNRVVDLYARWKIDALNLRPDLISILIGVNDTWHEFNSANGVEVPRYERIYREILQWTRQELPNVRFALMDPFVCPDMPDRAKFVPDVAARSSPGSPRNSTPCISRPRTSSTRPSNAPRRPSGPPTASIPPPPDTSSSPTPG